MDEIMNQQGMESPITAGIATPSTSFFTLPQEIRQQIYAYVLISPSTELIHLNLVTSPSQSTGSESDSLKVSSRRCSAFPPEPDIDPLSETSTSLDFEDLGAPLLVYNNENGKQVLQLRTYCPFGRAYELPKGRNRNHELSLPLVCKAIYAESACLVFSQAVWSTCEVYAFTRLQQVVSAEQWAALSRIQLDLEWFEPGWDGQRFDEAVPYHLSDDQNADLEHCLNAGWWHTKKKDASDRWSALWRALAQVRGQNPRGLERGLARSADENSRQETALQCRPGGLKTLKVWVDCHADMADGEPSSEGSQWLQIMMKCGLMHIQEVELRLRWIRYGLGMRDQSSVPRLSALEEEIKGVWMGN